MRAPTTIVDDLDSIDDLAPLDGYSGAVLDDIRRLLDDGTDSLEVCGHIAGHHERLNRRLLELAEADCGEPPCPYAWLLLGSHGRREQVPASDQDNAIVFDPATDAERKAAQEYFPGIAARVVTGLTRAGLPECDGGYMATLWCRPASEYTSLFRTWVEHPTPESLIKADVFLDMVAFHGELTVEHWDELLLNGAARGPFRAQMAHAAVKMSPPLGLFGRVLAREARVDVKFGGTAAIVALARLYGFTAGSRRRSTLDRLEDAAAKGTLRATTAHKLAEGYRLLTLLRLRHQVDQAAAGRPFDNRIPLESLTPDERTRLRRSLRSVRELQNVTAQIFSTYVMT